MDNFDKYLAMADQLRANNRDELVNVTHSTHTATNDEGKPEQIEGVDISFGAPYIAIAAVVTGLSVGSGLLESVGISSMASYLTQTALVGFVVNKVARRAVHNKNMETLESAYIHGLGTPEEKHSNLMMGVQQREIRNNGRWLLGGTALLLGSMVVMELSNNGHATGWSIALGIVGGLTSFAAVANHCARKLVADERRALVDKIVARRSDLSATKPPIP